MRKYFMLMVLALVAFQFSASAQVQVTFGAKAGIAVSKFQEKEEADISIKEALTGANAGLFLSVGNKYVAVQPEVLFTQKGSKYASGTLLETDHKISYLEVPVLVKAQLPISIVTPNVFAGPFVSFKFDEKTEIGDLSINIKDENTVDYGVTFGGGIDIAPTKNLVLTTDVRYDLGLDELEDGDGQSLEIKNGSWIFNVGIGLRF